MSTPRRPVAGATVGMAVVMADRLCTHDPLTCKTGENHLWASSRWSGVGNRGATRTGPISSRQEVCRGGDLLSRATFDGAQERHHHRTIRTLCPPSDDLAVGPDRGADVAVAVEQRAAERGEVAEVPLARPSTPWRWGRATGAGPPTARAARPGRGRRASAMPACRRRAAPRSRRCLGSRRAPAPRRAEPTSGRRPS